jgi:hypothetical protein
MNLQADLEKGSRADQLIKSQAYQDAYNGVRQAILDTWANSPIRDAEGQHELRLMLKLLDDLNGHLVSMLNTGKLASKQIENENKAKELAKRALEGISSVFR